MGGRGGGGQESEIAMHWNMTAIPPVMRLTWRPARVQARASVRRKQASQPECPASNSKSLEVKAGQSDAPVSQMPGSVSEIFGHKGTQTDTCDRKT